MILWASFWIGVQYLYKFHIRYCLLVCIVCLLSLYSLINIHVACLSLFGLEHTGYFLEPQMVAQSGENRFFQNFQFFQLWRSRWRLGYLVLVAATKSVLWCRLINDCEHTCDLWQPHVTSNQSCRKPVWDDSNIDVAATCCRLFKS